VDMLESLGPDAQGGLIKVGFGPSLKLDADDNGTAIEISKESKNLLRPLPPNFVIDNTGSLKKRMTRALNPNLPPDLKKEYQGKLAQLGNSIEAAMVPMPNRLVQPLETFAAKVPVLIGAASTGKKTKEADLELTCTYQGTRMRNQREEAIIKVVGQLKGRGTDAKKTTGAVSGKLGFDLTGGFISLAQLKIDSKLDLGGEVRRSIVFDIDLDRKAGNPLNIQLPMEKKADPVPVPPAPPPVAAVKTKTPLMNQAGMLALTDPPDPTQGGGNPKIKNSHMKVFPLNLKANKTYTISVTSTAFAPFIRVEMANGLAVANGGGAKNHTLTYAATAAGTYRIIVATHSANKVGAFQITVTESP
jgi:hypothetical protein